MDPTARLSGNTITLRKADLVFFIDEVGDIGCKDAHHPLFGFAGCACFGDEYDKVLRQPWLAMKERAFGGRGRKLHFSDMRNPGPRRRAALVEFLQRNRFFILCSAQTKSSDLPQEFTDYEAAATVLLLRLLETAEKAEACGGFSEVIVVFEASEKLDALHNSFFRRRGLTFGTGATALPIPSHYFRMSKDAGEAGLEVADLLGRTMGRQVRSQELGSKAKWLPDFSAFIQDLDPNLVSYMHLEKAQVTVKGRPLSRPRVDTPGDRFPLITVIVCRGADPASWPPA